MSTLTPRFLLDENVRIELARFLKSEGLDVKLVSKSSPDSLIASLSEREKRVLVTNDEDFCAYAEGEVFSVVWLRIPQNDPKVLIASFGKLVAQFKDFSKRLVILREGAWTDFPLGEWTNK